MRNLLILLLGGRDVKDKKDGKVDHCMSKQCFFLMEKQCFSSFSPENGVLKIEPTNSIKFKGSRLFRYKYKMSFETIYIIFVDD